MSTSHLRRLVRVWEEQAEAALRALRNRENAAPSANAAEEEREQALIRFFAYQYCLAAGKVAEGRETLEMFGGSGAVPQTERQRISSHVLEKCREEVESLLTMIVFAEQEYHGLFECCCDYRAVVAATRFHDDAELAQRRRSVGSRLAERCNEMSPADRTDLRDSVRILLSENWIYPNHDPGPGGDPYAPLFAVAGIPGIGEDMFVAGLDDAIQRARLSPDLSGLIREALNGLAEIVLEDGANLGGVRPEAWRGRLRLSSAVSIIPGDGSGPCPRVLIAWGAGKGRYSPKNVWPELQQALIRCGRQTDVAIFVTTLETTGGRILEESLGVARAHIHKGDLKAYFPVVLVGRKMTVLDWEP